MATDTLNTFRYTAKKIAKIRCIKHIEGLEIVAHALGKPHWRGLVEAYKQGWRPTPEQLANLPNLLSVYADTPAIPNRDQSNDFTVFGDRLAFTRWVPDDVKPMEADEIYGELDGHKFYLAGDEFEVAFGSQGWEISLDQAPSAKPELKRLGGRVKSVDALEPAFIENATQLLMIRARRMHAEVAADWPRRSTMPDKQGRALHPLGGGLSAEWHCLHCDGVHDGYAMAKNLWHCTKCGATPIDIFPEPFWNGVKQPA
ncbi:hypothetical protein [Agrobacterium tumefaciens]|uniref:hypothetical protein n=1 Tax=Agrobacterium tumefaciens TaxID=358 RepID=UPI00287E1529|nr:hypothetical protein [Agrobacterium tumefaciens]MDS7594924.1 hypothetical protein [Agrobacterium tumefaciens]